MSPWYHPTIQKLDAAAAEFHAMGMKSAAINSFRLAGQLQQDLLAASPYKTNRRFLHAQWVWALGHIGLLHQLIRWFNKTEPQTQLVLEATGAANPHFLQALSPHLTITLKLEGELQAEAMYNAVYFGCPDGIHSLVNFYKKIEQECSDIHFLELPPADVLEADVLLSYLNVKAPFVALHARFTPNDTDRNVTTEQIDKILEPYLDRGFQVVSTGLDAHPINARYRSVLELSNPHKASFLLSASCDQFIGSNSGAWTVAHAYQRPIELINDYDHSAWIYR